MNTSEPGQTPKTLLVHYLNQRAFIGALGISLPLLVWLFDFPWSGILLRSSISDYYYGEVSRNLFVGVLCAMACYLGTYVGYSKSGTSWLEQHGDNWLTNIAAICAIGVAFFPTDGATTAVHLTCAGALFISMAVMSAFQFTRGNTTKAERRLFRGSALVIAVVLVTLLVVMGISGIRDSLPNGTVFWLETVMLLAFGISWMAKGRAFQRMLGTGGGTDVAQMVASSGTT